ncbi:MAG TPA: amino acid permease [Gemmatimonadales bacterium]|nr:amino acid permease [Gemmatimonadales bacterium]
MTDLRRTLRLGDSLAMVVGIIVGSGIFRTPGLVAAQLGRPWLTFVAWLLGAALALLGAFVFAELATRRPRAGGKYVFVMETFGRRAGFVVGWVEALVIYPAAIAAIGVVCGEYAAKLGGLPDSGARGLGVGFVSVVTGVNLLGVRTGRWVQNVVTSAKVLALGAVVVIALAVGTGAGWSGRLPEAPSGAATLAALAAAGQAVIWTYYGYPEVAKIAEEVVDPNRTIPRAFLFGIAIVAALYVLLNAAFLHVLPFETVATSNLVAGDMATVVFGARGGAVMAAIALLVVLASLNGNVFATPRVFFGLARDGLAPASLALVNRGGTPWTATLAVGLVGVALAASGTFEWLLALSITLVLAVDGFTALALFRYRAREPGAAFRVPGYPLTAVAFVGVYALLLLGAALATPASTGVALIVLAAAYGASLAVRIQASATHERR